MPVGVVKEAIHHHTDRALQLMQDRELWQCPHFVDDLAYEHISTCLIRLRRSNDLGNPNHSTVLFTIGRHWRYQRHRSIVMHGRMTCMRCGIYSP